MGGNQFTISVIIWQIHSSMYSTVGHVGSWSKHDGHFLSSHAFFIKEFWSDLRWCPSHSLPQLPVTFTFSSDAWTTHNFYHRQHHISMAFIPVGGQPYYSLDGHFRGCTSPHNTVCLCRIPENIPSEPLLWHSWPTLTSSSLRRHSRATLYPLVLLVHFTCSYHIDLSISTHYLLDTESIQPLNSVQDDYKTHLLKITINENYHISSKTVPKLSKTIFNQQWV